MPDRHGRVEFLAFTTHNAANINPARPINAAPTLSGLIVGAAALELDVSAGSPIGRADETTPALEADEEVCEAVLLKLEIGVPDVVVFGTPEVTVSVPLVIVAAVCVTFTSAVAVTTLYPNCSIPAVITTSAFVKINVVDCETVCPVLIAFRTHSALSDFPVNLQSKINVFCPPSMVFVNPAVDGPLTSVAWLLSPAAAHNEVQRME